jgi:hypothetical protein
MKSDGDVPVVHPFFCGIRYGVHLNGGIRMYKSCKI